MRTALINPPPAQLVELHDLPDYPHPGLAYLAGYLEYKGKKVDVIDSKLERLSISKTLKRIEKIKPNLIGITAMTHDIIQAHSLATQIKKRFSIPIVIGGVHATALPKQTLEEFKNFDYLIQGEGEETFYKLITSLENKKNLSEVKGLVFRKKRKIVVNPPRPRPENLDELPMPAWHLFPRSKKYQIVTARGCPYHCVFCMSPYGKKIRERNPKNVIKEMKYVIENFNPEEYKFNDESFGFNKERAHKLLDLIIENNLGEIKKVASMRANYVDFKLLKHMRKAGFYMVDYGIESGDEKILKIIKKGVTLQQTEKAVKMTKKAGILVGGNFIIGHPYETKKTIWKTIRYAVKLNPAVVAFGIMVPYPGTQVAEMAKRGEGGYSILSSDWKDYNKELGNALELKSISRMQLETYQLIAYLSVYMLNFRITDFIKFCWQYRRAAKGFITHYIKNSINRKN